MALLAVALVRWLGWKPVRWLPAWGIAMLGVASHILLDLTNIYGVRLLLPFSGRWFHWDLTSVIDVTIWAVLLLSVAAPALGRLVSAEIGDQRKDAGKAGWAVTGLLLLFAYNYGRSLLHEKAVAQMDAHRYTGLTPRRSGAFPTQNPWRWTGMAELSTSYVSLPLNLMENFHMNDAVAMYKAEQSPEVEAAQRSEPFQRFQEFVDFPLWVTEPAPDAEGSVRVMLLDLRFGNPQSPGFRAVATVDPNRRVRDALVTMGGPGPR